MDPEMESAAKIAKMGNDEHDTTSREVAIVTATTSAIVSWGTASEVAGFGFDNDCATPRQVAALKSPVVQVASSRHTLFLCSGGALYSCGNNDHGQTGRSQYLGVPRVVDSLDAVHVTAVAVGEDFSVIVTSNGSVYSWGRNHKGQLGHGTRESVGKPRLVKGTLATKHVVQVACGRAHTLMLARTGEIFGCGDSNIGNGDVVGSLVPSPITHIGGAPVTQICCGDGHSLALTNSGVVWSWGENGFGQLGSGDGPNTMRPNVVRKLLGARVTRISAGALHSVTITEEGRAFSWGQGGFGQLGHGDNSNVSVPKVMTEFLGTHLVSCSAGRRCTMFIDDQGRVFGTGQGQVFASKVPVVVEDALVANAKGLWLGNLANFAVVGPSKELEAEEARRRSAVYYINDAQINEAKTLTSPAELLKVADFGFSIASIVNGSFLDPERFFSTNGEDCWGVDLRKAEDFMKWLDSKGGAISEALSQAWSRLIRLSLDQCSLKSPENFRVWLVAFFNPWMLRPAQYHVVIDRLLVSLVGLHPDGRRVLEQWWKALPLDQYMHIVNVLQVYLAFLSQAPDLANKCATAAIALGRLHDARRDYDSTAFYNPTLSRNIDLVRELSQWSAQGRVFSWLNYPYLLDAPAKAKLVGIAFKLSQQLVVFRDQMPFSIVAVRRATLFEDAVSMLHSLTDDDLRRPLKVVFVGEEAVDQGGPARELFHQLLLTILDPNYGLFQFNPDTGKNWFNTSSDAGSAVLYEVIGLAVGLAIANGIILNANFPLFLYSKLLGTTEAKMSHLRQVDPALAKGLADLLAMEGNIEDLGLTFSVTKDVLGETKTVNLVENGDNINVDSRNVKRYVEAYRQYVLHDSVEAQFRAFERGYRRVVRHNKAMSLLDCEELRKLVEGQGDTRLNLLELRAHTKYLPPLSPTSDVVVWFWNVISRLNQEQSRKFLLFCTGSTGVPIQGLSVVPFAMQLSGDDPNRLIVAHTCANVIDLPPYRTEQDLEAKLLYAINETTGFGIV